MRTFIRHRAGRNDVDDLVQAVFVAFWKKPEEVTDSITAAPEPVQRAWLFRAAVNEIAASHRAGYRRQRRLRRFRLFSRPSPHVDCDDDDTPMGRTIAQLSVTDTQVVVAIFFNDLTAAETADLLDLSVPAVYQRLSRALRRVEALYLQELRTAQS